ncbi:MAG: YjfB family protein [Desulfosarcina sp.]|nr:YjfB family protein [Desulfobacterales bacterium]
MEIDTVSVAQSNAIRDVGPSVLDKSLNQKEEQALGIGNHGREVKNTKSDDPSLGQNIDLFT